MSPSLDRVLAALREADCDPVADGDQWAALCPTHEDARASLKIRHVPSGRTVLYCHAGCETPDILKEIGLKYNHLYDNNRDIKYAYSDGRINVRRGNKQFFQQNIPKEKLGALYTAGLTLDRVRELGKAGKTIYIVDGEDDATVLRQQKRIAVSKSPNGVKRTDWSPLYGARVIIIPDLDGGAGEKQAAETAALLARGSAHTRIRFRAAKEGKDVLDHILHGYGLEELRPIDIEYVEAEESGNGHSHNGSHVRLRKASEGMIVKPTWVWEQRILKASLHLAAGYGGVGKGVFASHLIAQLTHGTLPGCYEGSPIEAAIVSSEDDWGMVIRPRLLVAGADLDLVHEIILERDGEEYSGLRLPRDLVALEDALSKQGVKFVFLDPLTSMLEGGSDLHSNKDVRDLLDPIVRMAQGTGVTFYANAHLNKGSVVTGDSVHKINGSSAFSEIPRSIFLFAKDPNNKGTRILSQAKNNVGNEDLPNIAFAMTLETIPGERTESGESTESPRIEIVDDDYDMSAGQAIAAAAKMPNSGQTTELEDAIRQILEAKKDWILLKEIVEEIEARGIGTRSGVKKALSRLGSASLVEHKGAGPKSWYKMQDHRLKVQVESESD